MGRGMRGMGQGMGQGQGAEKMGPAQVQSQGQTGQAQAKGAGAGVGVTAVRSVCVEAVVAVAAIVLETLGVVSEQVERRSYGAQSLAPTIRLWEQLQRQCRVVLLLASRVGTGAGVGMGMGAGGCGGSGGIWGGGVGGVGGMGMEGNGFTVHNIGAGCVSLHRLLATDSLAFALRAEQAREHEDRCRDVFARSTYHSYHSRGTGGGGGAGG
ncbi:hypothetical protein B484DRAFT_414669, partial [Ochromonadaceae sp. CCMP2298]